MKVAVINRIIKLNIFFILFMIFCSVVDAYDTYKIGDEVFYNGIKFYVIENSNEENEAVVALKAESLTVEEVTKFASDHLNLYTYIFRNVPYDIDGYGLVAYYSSISCGYASEGVRPAIQTDCKSNYKFSDIKYIVDAWGQSLFEENDLVVDSKGYTVRLLSYKDLTNNLGYKAGGQSIRPSSNGDTFPFVYENNVGYWTMSQYYNTQSSVWIVMQDGTMVSSGVGWELCGQNCYGLYAIRPVANIKKESLSDLEIADESIIDTPNDSNMNSTSGIEDNSRNKESGLINEENTKKETILVNVPNTYEVVSMFSILLGFSLAIVSIFLYYFMNNTKSSIK